MWYFMQGILQNSGNPPLPINYKAGDLFNIKKQKFNNNLN